MKAYSRFPILAFACLFFLSFTACKNDTPVAEAPTQVPLPQVQNTGIPAPAPDLPYSCSVLTSEMVREIFDYGEEHTLLPIHGQALGSCYYKLTTENWTADLVLEPIDPLNKDAVDADIAQATADERTTLAGHPARWKNDGRILNVGAPKPFAVKLSVLPRGQYGQAVDETQRRAWIVAVAEAVVGKL